MGRALIVSAGASSNEYISARLAELGYTRPTIIPSGTEARRRMLESDFELIVVNAPLPDEFGHELCSSAVEKTDAGVVLLAIGLPHEVAHGSLRLSVGEYNTDEEMAYIVDNVRQVVAYLRSISPVWDELETGARPHLI